MTEMIAPAIHGDAQTIPAEGALGRPSPAYQVRVLSPGGQPARSGETGDLLVKGLPGQSIFLEYDGDENATQNAFDPDGFFRTGDRVTVLDGGWLKFSDRASDIIKVGGEGVSPLEIETVIRAVPGVRDVAVVGAADATYGEIPVAFIETDPTGSVRIEELILQSCRASLAKFKVPRRIVSLPALPRVGNAKISRAKLRQMLTSETTTNGRTSICEKDSAKL
jgi:crotonobetaine/carnitine-CoA ligase